MCKSSEKVLSILKCDTLESRRKNHVLKLVMKCINGNVPQFLIDSFKFNRDVVIRITRQSGFRRVGQKLPYMLHD